MKILQLKIQIFFLIDPPMKNNLIISNKDGQGISFEKYFKDFG